MDFFGKSKLFSLAKARPHTLLMHFQATQEKKRITKQSVANPEGGKDREQRQSPLCQPDSRNSCLRIILDGMQDI